MVVVRTVSMQCAIQTAYKADGQSERRDGNVSDYKTIIVSYFVNPTFLKPQASEHGLVSDLRSCGMLRSVEVQFCTHVPGQLLGLFFKGQEDWTDMLSRNVCT
jgi:hypothetical protein